MVKTIIGAVLLAGLSASAMAQTEDEVTAAIGKELDAYVKCLEGNVYEMSKESTDDIDLIINRSISNCEAERQTLADASRRSSLGWSGSRADDEIAAIVRTLRPKLAAAAQNYRG